MSGYFVLRSSEDGTTIYGPFPEAELLKRITPDKNGETCYGGDLRFLDAIPVSDKGCWCINTDRDNPILIIKGEIIVPKQKQVVTVYEL